jgi:hypothetical protein
MMKSFRQFSVRQGLILVFVTAFAVAGLSSGGIAGSLFLILSFTIVTAFVITAFVARGHLRSYSIGFIVPALLYATVLFVAGETELDPYDGKLPTTSLVKPLFESMLKTGYVDPTTGKVVQDYDPTKPFGGMGGGGMGGGGVTLVEIPNRTTFMSLAHAILVLIFGYVGSIFFQIFAFVRW